MKIHKRHEAVNAATGDLIRAVGEVVKKHDLTYGELFSLFAECLASYGKYLVRDERAPKRRKKGESV